MNKNLFIASVIALVFGVTGTSYADTLMGKVTSIDQEGNAITLTSESPNSTERKEHKLVWDADMAESQQLENARIDQILTVDAEQNAVTRNWKVRSVRGPAAAAEQALLRTDERIISGEVAEFDLAGRSLLLRSKELDNNNQPAQYRVVWDATNTNVTEKLQNAKIGDNLTLAADQNVITKNWKANSISGPIRAMAQGDVHTIAGQVKEVNRDKNFIVLNTTSPSGKADEQKIVWDDDFKQQARLENAKVGEHLSVRADQNMLTRNWKVTAIG